MFLFRGSSEILINTFSFGRHVFCGGHLILQPSCIQVNTVNVYPESSANAC